MKFFGIQHYITKFTDLRDNRKKATSWIQLDLFGKAYCFWVKEMEI